MNIYKFKVSKLRIRCNTNKSNIPYVQYFLVREPVFKKYDLVVTVYIQASLGVSRKLR